MNEEAQFITTGKLNEAFFHRNSRYLLSPKYIRTKLILLAVVTVLLLGSYFLMGRPLYLIMLAVYAVFSAAMLFVDRNRAAKTLTKRLLETAPDGEVLLTTSCTDSGIRSENHTNGGTTEIEYKHLSTLAVAEGAMILMTKASQFTVLFTDCLTEQELRELQVFIEEKCPQIKIKR